MRNTLKEMSFKEQKECTDQYTTLYKETSSKKKTTSVKEVNCPDSGQSSVRVNDLSCTQLYDLRMIQHVQTSVLLYNVSLPVYDV